MKRVGRVTCQQTEPRSSQRKVKVSADHAKVLTLNLKSGPSRIRARREHSSNKDRDQLNSYHTHHLSEDDGWISSTQTEFILNQSVNSRVTESGKFVVVNEHKALRKVPSTPVISIIEFDIVSPKQEDWGDWPIAGAAECSPSGLELDGPGSQCTNPKGKFWRG